jgi:hypothetical protein
LEGLAIEDVCIFMAIWSILQPFEFGVFFPVLVSCIKKNMATLLCAEST